MKEYDFLNAVCGEIKYKTIHKEIRSELTSHIDEFADRYGEIYGDSAREMAVKQMGDAKELGKMLNRSYRMPFNCSFGLMIWALLNTILGWTVYPFWMKIWRLHPTNATFAAAVVLLYCVLNVFYLRRAHFRFALRDWGHIAAGVLIGSAVSVAALLLISKAGDFGYYPYGYKCLIPYKWNPVNYDMPMLLFFFGIFWMIYMFSLGKPKGKKEFWIVPYRGNISFSEMAQNVTDNDSFDIYGNKVSRGKIIGDRD